MSEHSRIGPSSLSRVRLCPGSVRAVPANAPRRTNIAAAEGTLLHDIAATCLEEGFEPADFIGQRRTVDGFEFVIGKGPGEVDPECMGEGLDWLREQPGELFIETRIELDPYMPGQFGRLDVGILDGATLTVFDWKFGVGVPVATVGNEQIRAYAIGLLRHFEQRSIPWPTKIRLIIEQPRRPGGARYHRPWEITLAELLEFTDTLRAIWKAAEDPTAPRVAGPKQCQFCEAKLLPGGCDAHSEYLLDLMGSKFADLDDDAEPALPLAGQLTPERRSRIVLHSQMITGWLGDLKASAIEDALAERPTPGLKLVEGDMGDRKWGDEESARAELESALREDAFTLKLKSPAQAEKILKPRRKFEGKPEAWERLKALITRDPGKPSLVPEHDPRPSLKSVDDKFDED